MDTNIIPNDTSNKPLVVHQNVNALSFPGVLFFKKMDASYYEFSCDLGEDIRFRMEETDGSVESGDLFEAKFEKSITQAERPYYLAAAASGLVTGVLAELDFSDKKLETCSEWKEKDWSKYVVGAARVVGYKRQDQKGAVRFLISKMVQFAEGDEENTKFAGIRNYLRMLSSNPSLAGLVFSILTQFSEEKYQFDDKGQLKRTAVPEYYAIGRTWEEKVIFGILHWLLSVAICAVVSNRRIIEAMRIPKSLINMLKEFTNLSIVRNIPLDQKEIEETFSKWLCNIFMNDAEDEAENNIGSKIKDQLIGIVDEARMVALNECIFRSCYSVLKLIEIIKQYKPKSFEELGRLDFKDAFPGNNRVVVNMSVIASGVFAAVNIAGAAVKAVYKQKKSGMNYGQAFIAEINIAAVGRFAFAVAKDFKYWKVNGKVFFEKIRIKKKQETKTETEETVQGSFTALELDALQARLLYCFENIAVCKDIERTEKQAEKQAKAEWLSKWRFMIASGMQVDPETYFVEDEDLLYQGLYSFSLAKENWRWLYLLTMEFALFEAYKPFGSVEDNTYKGLNQKYDYLSDQFIRRQTVVSQDELEQLRSQYRKYTGFISGSSQNKLITAGAMAVAAITVGSAAFVMAPGIAIALAGEAVAGLHGAALTSASLAFIGGGSIAAGGLGMVGGTAIITGGGALLGLASTGTTSMIAIMAQTNSDFFIRQCAKILTFSKIVLSKRLHDEDSVNIIKNQLIQNLTAIQSRISDMEKEKDDFEKESLKKLKECQKYYKRTVAEMEKF